MRRALAQRTGFYEVWSKVVSGGSIHEVPVNIRSSWERCLNARVNPRKEPALMRIDQVAIRKRIDEQSDLHQILKTHHKNIEEFFSFLPIGIFFADKDGYVLSFAGDEKIFKRMEESSQTAIIGSSIKEEIIGTTAPGICLEENRFAAVNAEEHFIQDIHWASCIASPIFDGGKNLLGALDFTVAWEDKEKLRHLIPILFNTANSIQFELSIKKKLDQLELFHSYYHSTFDYSRSILVMVNTRGEIIDLNQQAKEFFKVNAQGIKNRDVRALLGDKSKIELLFKESGGKISLGGRNSDFLVIDSIPLFDPAGQEMAFLLKFEKEKVFKTIPERVPRMTRYTFRNIIGSSPQINHVVDRAKRAAKTGSTILIEGETGTGKELFAQAIHSESPQGGGPFIALNCAAIPHDLIESELFGYEKGAYTGARQDGNTGKFELANGGTIFLDEIHLMDLSAQTKLLRVIEERRLTRIGGKYAIPLNIRIIVASSVDLKKEMEKGLFTPALFFRINVVKLSIPSLRERKEDIPLLITYLIGEMNQKFNRSITAVDPEALEILGQFSWPGNVRELKNCLESAYNFCTGKTIGLTDVSDHISFESEPEAVTGQTMEAITREVLIGSLNRFGTVKEAANSLGIPLSTFYRKMKEFGFNRQQIFKPGTRL